MKRLLIAAALALTLVACNPRGTEAPHGHGHGLHEEAPEGPHGGHLLVDSELELEVGIDEGGAAPRLQAWLYRDGRVMAPGDTQVQVTLTRLDGSEETQTLVAQADGSLRGTSAVAEPHSFDIEVELRLGARAAQWNYASYENRTEIPAAIAAAAGVRVAPAGPATLADEHEVQGLLIPIDDRTARVTARWPGPIRTLEANVGDRVRVGQTLAQIDSNQSLGRYTVTSPIAGVVMARSATLGMNAGESGPLFEIADLSELWVDLHLFGNDANHITAGAPLTVTRLGDGISTRTTLERVLPGVATVSQSTVARAVVRNEDGAWRPGAAVKGRITVAQREVALAVPLTALQEMGGRPVVFIRIGEAYEARPVILGERDAQQVEVLGGLTPGDPVVVEQSYLIKADIEKAGAAHEH